MADVVPHFCETLLAIFSAGVPSSRCGRCLPFLAHVSFLFCTSATPDVFFHRPLPLLQVKALPPPFLPLADFDLPRRPSASPIPSARFFPPFVMNRRIGLSCRVEPFFSLGNDNPQGRLPLSPVFFSPPKRRRFRLSILRPAGEPFSPTGILFSIGKRCFPYARAFSLSTPSF